MSGTINVARSLWSDPTFKDSEVSQREAWIWLIAEASWKSRTRRFGSFVINLERAQLAVSTRFLAKAWRWSEARVRRYLDKLENQRMIQRGTDAGISVITICNYDKFQNKPHVGDAGPTRQPARDRRTTDANENKGEIREKEDKEADAEDARAHEPENSIDGLDEKPQERDQTPVTQDADLTEREMLVQAMGYEPDRGLGYTAIGRMVGSMSDIREYRAWRDDLGLTWEEVIGVITEVTANRKDAEPPASFKYFTKAMQRLAADKERPPLQPDGIQSTNNYHRKKNSRSLRRQQSDDAWREMLERVRSGEIQLGTEQSDPWAD